jgi:cytochrome c-type biogenesis protein
MTGLSLTTGVNFFMVLAEGLISFFSPCVIPLIPIYISYLAGNAKTTAEDGAIIYNRKKVFLHTLAFILGISSAFFILGMSVNALSFFFKSNQIIFVRLGGIFIVILGLIQTGFLKFGFLQREHRFRVNFAEGKMNPAIAYLMGFTFSFAWTPCIGPALTSVLILAAGSNSRLTGNLLILVYTAGFAIPFLLLGLFTSQALTFLKKHQKALKYTVKVGGVLLIIIGIMTFTGWMNGISKYLNSYTPGRQDNSSTIDLSDENDETQPIENNSSGSNAASDASSDTGKKKYAAYDFTLIDQYGNEHTLSDYKGKVVFINFWATWCPPCREELPDIEAVYKEYGKNSGDVIIIGLTNPVSDEYPDNADITKDKILEFIAENNLSFPVLFDETGVVFSNYYISAFPTTFLIDTDGNIFGYAPGMMSKDMMISAIEQTQESTQSE